MAARLFKAHSRAVTHQPCLPACAQHQVLLQTLEEGTWGYVWHRDRNLATETLTAAASGAAAAAARRDGARSLGAYGYDTSRNPEITESPVSPAAAAPGRVSQPFERDDSGHRSRGFGVRGTPRSVASARRDARGRRDGGPRRDPDSALPITTGDRRRARRVYPAPPLISPEEPARRCA